MVVGISILLDFSGVVDERFHCDQVWRDLIGRLIQMGGMKMLHLASHQFSSVKQKELADERNLQTGGTTAFALLSESHISVHTWPEFKKVVIDIFTCGPTIRLDDMIEYLREHIPHENLVVTRFERGE
ncbi:MAG: S-adenosylmethionine decarboxylase family protein [Candidatus Thorarchaeota archaeon]